MTLEHFGENNNKQGQSGAPLGIIAKSSPEKKFDHDKARRNRSERYTLHGVSRSILAAQGVKEGLLYPYNYHRTCTCKIAEIDEFVKTKKIISDNKAFFSGVVTCGSVWACPICTMPIQEHRRMEIATILEAIYEKFKKKAAMVTLTFPHKREMALNDTIAKQKLALKYFRSGNGWTRFCKFVGFSGLVRSLEVTHSENNGWHPHTHELWVMDSWVDLQKTKFKFGKKGHQKEYSIDDFILEMWKQACIKAGLLHIDTPDANQNLKNEVNFELRAVDIKDNARSSDYFAKMDESKNWGADRELAKASSKTGKKSGNHPFAILDNYRIDNDARSAQLWLEYVAAFKGKAQIYISPKLRKLVELDYLMDEQAADEERTQPADNIDNTFLFTRFEWRQIVRKRLRTKVLDMAELEDAKGINKLLAEHNIERSVITDVMRVEILTPD